MRKLTKEEKPWLFSSTHQPPVKWTEEILLELAEELIKWISPNIEKKIVIKGDKKMIRKKDLNKNNLFIKAYLSKFPTMHSAQIHRLRKKYKSFDLLYSQAKRIQESKLATMGLLGDTHAGMTTFMLKNHHGYKDSQHLDHTSKGEKMSFASLITKAGELNPVKQREEE